MAGNTIPLNAKVTPVLPNLSFIVDTFGDLIGFQYMNGQITLFPAGACDNGLTAFSGGGQAGLNLNYRNARVTTVAVAADSVTLPVAIPGMSMTVVNAAAANSMNIFPATGDAINALAANTAIALAANKTMQFECINVGQWHSILTA